MSYPQSIIAVAISIPILLCTSMVFAQPESNILEVIEGKGEPPSGETIEYFEGAKGYITIPEGDGPFGSIILIHEWNGLVERVKQVADSLANEGYIALAADLYEGNIGSSRDENIALVQAAREDEAKLVANLNAAVKYLKEREDSNGTVATIGWCFGGGVALTFAMGGDNHEGTAIFYGSLLYDPEQMEHIHHEFHGTFAAEDRGIPVKTVEEFAQALKDAGIPNDIHIYDAVQHGFWLYVERDVETNQEPAKHAWGRLKSFFGRVLNPGQTDEE